MEQELAKNELISLNQIKIVAYNRIIYDNLRLSDAEKLPQNERVNRECVKILTFLQDLREPDDPHIRERAVILQKQLIDYHYHYINK